MNSFNFFEKLVLRDNGTQKPHLIILDDFPAWISKTVVVYAFNWNQDYKVYLVKAKKDLAYDQLINLSSGLNDRFLNLNI